MTITSSLTALEQRLLDGDDTVTAQDLADATKERFEDLRKEAQDRKEEELKREQRKAEAVEQAHAAINGHSIEDLAEKWITAEQALRDLIAATNDRNAAIAGAAQPLVGAFGGERDSTDRGRFTGASNSSSITLEGVGHRAYKPGDIIERLIHALARDHGGLPCQRGLLTHQIGFSRENDVEKAAKRLNESRPDAA